MSYREVYKCDVCLDEIGRECLQVRFINNEQFKIEAGSNTARFHMCLSCATQMRDQLNELTRAARGKEASRD